MFLLVNLLNILPINLNGAATIDFPTLNNPVTTSFPIFHAPLTKSLPKLYAALAISLVTLTIPFPSPVIADIATPTVLAIPVNTEPIKCPAPFTIGTKLVAIVVTSHLLPL